MSEKIKLVIERELELPKMSLMLESNGIVYCKYKKDAVVFRHDVEEGVKQRIEMFGDESRKFLVDITYLKGISLDARRFFASKKGAFNIKAVAFYIDSLELNDLAINYLEEHELPYSAEVFNNIDKARNWLLSLD